MSKYGGILYDLAEEGLKRAVLHYYVKNYLDESVRPDNAKCLSVGVWELPSTIDLKGLYGIWQCQTRAEFEQWGGHFRAVFTLTPSDDNEHCRAVFDTVTVDEVGLLK